MDFETRGDYLPPKPENSDNGYSEKDSAKVIEGSFMDIKSQKKRKPAQVISRQEKIIAAYRANTEKILRLVQSIYELNAANARQEEQIVEDIRRLRHLQEELLTALLLEQKGSLSKDNISHEAWSLIG